MNKNDIYILMVFAKENRSSLLKSFSVANLIKTIDGKYSHTKVREVIKNFKNLGYLQEGFKQGNSKTYYITKNGIDFLEEIGGVEYDKE